MRQALAWVPWVLCVATPLYLCPYSAATGKGPGIQVIGSPEP